jgi:hypothetical protein
MPELPAGSQVRKKEMVKYVEKERAGIARDQAEQFFN